MSWIAVGVVGASVVMQYSAGRQAKKAAGQEAELNREAGQQRKAAAEFEANVLEGQASNVVGAAQRDMLDVQRQTRLAQSRAVALAAASGGGASAPTVTKLVGDLAKEGSYNAARALYAGEEKAFLMQQQAEQLRKSGEFAELSGNLQANASESRGRAAQLQSYGNMLSSVGGLYGKYGGNGPATGKTDYFQFTGYGAAGDYQYG